MLKFVEDERGEVIEEMFSVPVLLGVSVIMSLIFGVFIFASIIISMNNVNAARAADLYASGDNVASAFNVPMAQVSSLSQLQNCRQGSCYYEVPGCSSTNRVCVVDVSKPVDVFGATVVLVSKGVAPWQTT